MIDNINLINGAELCSVCDWYGDAGAPGKMWQMGGCLAALKKEITSFSKCQFPSCTGIPRRPVAAGRTVSATSDTLTEGNRRNANTRCKTHSWLGQGWLGWRQLLLFPDLESTYWFPDVPKGGSFSSCSWHWPEITHQGSRHNLSTLPRWSSGLYTDIRSSAG